MIYLDNASTTPIDPEVKEAILPYLNDKFGNPSSIHSWGRSVKMDIEMARKSAAKRLGALPGEIFFTSGGTESMNAALIGMARAMKNNLTIVSTPIEHHATLHTIDYLKESGLAETLYLSVDREGNIDMDELDNCLARLQGDIIVCIMAANNEIGVLYDIKAIGDVCKKYGAIFICDMVQYIGHYGDIHLSETNVHLATASGHKFHSPKGIGLLYIKSGLPQKSAPYIHGGSQERNMRAGTENVCGIIGMAKALEIQTDRLPKDKPYIEGLKEYMKKLLKESGIAHEIAGNQTHALYSLLNAAFPLSEKTEMLSYRLDMLGIAISTGSACSSGSMHTSHVIEAIGMKNIVPIRFSFSKYNTKEEIDITVNELKKIIQSS